MIEMPVGQCALCRETRELRDSHLLPRALYRYIRIASGSDPVAMTKAVSFQTCWQVSDYFLCGECEQRFNVNGERWVLDHCYRGPARFRLQEALKKQAPLHTLSGAAVYGANLAAPGSVERLVYFASSVFWRASAHPWRLGTHVLKRIELGARYLEELRQFLLGKADLPENAVIVVHIAASGRNQPTVTFPWGAREQEYFRYRFGIPGIVFDLYIGGRLPRNLRQLCILRSPENRIFLGPQIENQMEESVVRAFGNSRATGKLKDLVP